MIDKRDNAYWSHAMALHGLPFVFTLDPFNRFFSKNYACNVALLESKTEVGVIKWNSDNVYS